MDGTQDIAWELGIKKCWSFAHSMSDREQAEYSIERLFMLGSGQINPTSIGSAWY